MRCSNIKKRKQPQTNLKKENEVRRMSIVNYFQIKFDEDASVVSSIKYRSKHH